MIASTLLQKYTQIVQLRMPHGKAYKTFHYKLLCPSISSASFYY